MTLSATMNGKFKIEIETPAAIGEATYEDLGHPELSKLIYKHDLLLLLKYSKLYRRS
jgi:hypothetical protein